MEEMWLARDSDRSLFLYIGCKPRKGVAVWIPPIKGQDISLNRDLFPEVQWSDEEPTKVKLVIDK